ncbi:putative serine/threonine-protein kinase PkwA [Streptomyces ambofaciens ATCC 23877]|uniref:Putative serine/threonine-protein kinase PkwA n=1 Tax=Streptomyces ambofaciens (strain ATCC 23877 / 3486 / DSM 40053 / JCM 4204 / NBRC 12836 / NRRL B-2516) TaxID=278992 RepID=A0A0K2AW62_STRA7|nr:serine/threonine-protein kinase [Streptomyces ambofaciens]AKZ57042.1 putative serine/threonine-protein kinase PkwA [Streptomyces ambofaciens ATCC 23877]
MEKLGGGDPRHIGAYRLLGRLGAGGMGHVYLARSDRGRTVAVKLVRTELAAQEEFRERFRQEVESARRVGGYWTAPVLDADTEAAVPWVATGYVAGPSLQQVVGHDHGALPERSVRTLAAGLAHALQDIHAAGIVHRDLKPSNVLVTIDGPRVIDFGIARALQTVTDGGLTRTGALVGSPGFMAPEQVRGDRITPACDVFCLGSVLAYAATGALPFGTANSGVHALMFRIAQEEPDLDGVPEGIADLVRDCLKKDPAARPGLAEVLARTGAQDTVADGRSRDPWLPGALVAQLGRHAVRLLDTENPEAPGAAGTGAVAASGPEPAAPGGNPPPNREPVAAPPDGPPPPREPGSGGTPLNHLPTLVAGQSPPTPPPAAHGHSQPPAHGYAPAYGYPAAPPPGYHPHGGGLGSTPPYGPPPAYGPPHGPSRRGRSTAVLVAVALVVALGAGGSVYALMSGDDDGGGRADGDPVNTVTAGASQHPGPTADGSAPTTGTDPTPEPASPTVQEGTIPTAYLGTWSTTIDNASGVHTRRLTIQQGEVGDTVLSLVAEGPAGNGTYHCVFEADLSSDPGADGPLDIGPSTVTVGPATTCTPGDPSRVRLLPDGTLERTNTGTDEKLTYRRQ